MWLHFSLSECSDLPHYHYYGMVVSIHDYAEDDDDYAAGYQHFGKSGSAYTCSWECVETCVCDWLLNFVLRYV